MPLRFAQSEREFARGGFQIFRPQVFWGGGSCGLGRRGSAFEGIFLKVGGVQALTTTHLALFSAALLHKSVEGIHVVNPA